MPASLALEEKLLKATIVGETYTSLTEVWIGLSSFKLEAGELTKKTTAKEFGEKEPKEAEGWTRIKIKAEAASWEAIKKGEGATGFTKYENAAVITFKKLTGAEEITLRTFAICEKAKFSEAGNILYFGTLTTPVTISKATSELTIPAKELLVEAE